MRDVGLTLALVLALVACTAEPAAESGGEVTTVATSGDSSGSDTGTTETGPDAEGAAPGGAGFGNRGEATLTIGDVVYTFDNYYCVSGSEETLNDNVPFSSGAFGEVDGVRVQLDTSVYDPAAQDRMTGDGVIAAVTLDDIEDFENPSVSWGTAIFGDPVVIEYDGSTVRVEAVFDDGLTDEFEEIPGVLEATCGE